MTITDVIGGFVSGNIAASVFEDFLYKNLSLFEAELPQLFLQMISADYSDDNEVVHLKNLLREHYGESLNKYNDAFFEAAADRRESLSELIDRPAKRETLVFDCGGISSAHELQSAIKRMFDFPDWYGMNWDAFNDLVCLSGVREVVLKNFEVMKQRIPDDAEIFLDIIQTAKDSDLTIIIT